MVGYLEGVDYTYFITFSRSCNCCGRVLPAELEISLFGYGIHNARGRRPFYGKPSL